MISGYPYPRKYNVLAVKLHEYYTAEKKKRGVHKLQKGYIPRPRRKNDNFSSRRHSFKRYPAKRAGAKNKPVCCTQDSLRVIPMEFYKDACRKLMPPQESISGLVIAFFFHPIPPQYCTSGGNEGFQITYEIVNGNSDNGSSEGNERLQLRLTINPSSDTTPLLSYGTFDHSEDTTQQKTATGTLSASSETLV